LAHPLRLSLIEARVRKPVFSGIGAGTGSAVHALAMKPAARKMKRLMSRIVRRAGSEDGPAASAAIDRAPERDPWAEEDVTKVEVIPTMGDLLAAVPAAVAR
jgi:hypothetical protein